MPHLINALPFFADYKHWFLSPKIQKWVYAWNQEIPWHKIDASLKETKSLSTRLKLDFKQLIRVTKQNNGALKVLLKSLFR